MTNSSIPRAYDGIAPIYDDALTPNTWMRGFLWRKYLQHFRAGDHILDVACGTGLDALYFAQNQICVTGMDRALRMLTELKKKAATNEFQPQLNAVVADFSRMPFRQYHRFDGAISSFAGLNTTDNLTLFSQEISRLLKPGSHLFIHMLNHFCVWEWLALLGKGKWKQAKQYTSRKEFNVSIAGVSVPHFLYSPKEMYQDYFKNDFKLYHIYGLAVLRPPSYLKGVPTWLVKPLEQLEGHVNNLPLLRSWGYFFFLDMVKR